MPRKTSVRKVKFTPEEMAFEPLADYSHLKFRRARPHAKLVELDPDVAKFFRNATAVNKALRMFIKAIPAAQNGKRKKSA